MTFLAITLILSIIPIFGNIADFVKITNAIRDKKTTQDMVRDMIRNSFFFEPLEEGYLQCDTKIHNLHSEFWHNNLICLIPVFNIVATVGWVYKLLTKNKTSCQKRLSDMYNSKIHEDL